MNSITGLQLEQLINSCCASDARTRDKAWSELLQRYHKYIYKVISKKCQAANVSQISLNFSETVNDIYQDVMVKLFKDDCNALRNFRHKDKERVFLSWLAKLANSAAFHHIMKYFSNPTQNIDIYDLKNVIAGFSVEFRPQFYEDQVRILRASVKSAKNIERDINIFTLSVWQGFDLDMLLKIPCLQDVNEKIIYNVNHRMRNSLSENRDFLD